jgi:hypothetical protein
VIVVRVKFRVKGSGQYIPLVTTVTRGTLPAANCFHLLFFTVHLTPSTAYACTKLSLGYQEPKDSYFLFLYILFQYIKKDTGEGGLDRAEHLAKATNRGFNLALAPFFFRREKKSEKSAP